MPTIIAEAEKIVKKIEPDTTMKKGLKEAIQYDKTTMANNYWCSRVSYSSIAQFK